VENDFAIAPIGLEKIQLYDPLAHLFLLKFRISYLQMLLIDILIVLFYLSQKITKSRFDPILS
jgi:hypothetical protein